MTLAAFRDWLKTLDAAEHYAIGRLNHGEEKSLGVFDRGGSGGPVMALGGEENGSYGVRDVRLLLHWNRNARETEAAARALWQAVYRAAHFDLPGGGHVQFLQPAGPGPVPHGADPDGVYEYSIDLKIYYRR